MNWFFLYCAIGSAYLIWLEISKSKRLDIGGLLVLISLSPLWPAVFMVEAVDSIGGLCIALGDRICSFVNKQIWPRPK